MRSFLFEIKKRRQPQKEKKERRITPVFFPFPFSTPEMIERFVSRSLMLK